MSVSHKMFAQLCEERLKEACANKTPPWEIEYVNTVQLKSNKSRDPSGYGNELFRPENTGEDLKIAVLKMMNQKKTNNWFLIN